MQSEDSHIIALHSVIDFQWVDLPSGQEPRALISVKLLLNSSCACMIRLCPAYGCGNPEQVLWPWSSHRPKLSTESDCVSLSYSCISPLGDFCTALYRNKKPKYSLAGLSIRPFTLNRFPHVSLEIFKHFFNLLYCNIVHSQNSILHLSFVITTPLWGGWWWVINYIVF